MAETADWMDYGVAVVVNFTQRLGSQAPAHAARSQYSLSGVGTLEGDPSGMRAQAWRISEQRDTVIVRGVF